MYKLKSMLFILMIMMLSSCATVFSGTTQTINLQAVDAEDGSILTDTHCFITDGDGTTYPINSNPGSAVVTKGKGALQFNCRKEGYAQGDVGVGSSFNGVTLVNVLFWPGAIVDGVTGAYSKYPSHVVVQMENISDEEVG